MYTMPEILMAIAAVGVVLNSAIQQWRQSTKIQETLISAKVTEGHVNSKETKYVEELKAKDREIELLNTIIIDKDKDKALLAQSASSSSRARVQDSPSDPTLDKIEVNTDATAKNTAKTDATVTKLRKRS